MPRRRARLPAAPAGRLVGRLVGRSLAMPLSLCDASYRHWRMWLCSGGRSSPSRNPWNDDERLARSATGGHVPRRCTTADRSSHVECTRNVLIALSLAGSRRDSDGSILGTWGVSRVRLPVPGSILYRARRKGCGV